MGKSMLLEYIEGAMKKAQYEILPDGEGYYGKIPQFRGVWASAETLEDCRYELQEVLDEWIVISLKDGKGSLKNKLSILGVESPVLQGVKMQAYREYAEFSQRSRTG